MSPVDDDVEGSLETDAAIVELVPLERVDDEALIRAEWGETFDGFLANIAETGAVVLQAIGTNGRWTFELRFPDHEALRTFHGTCLEGGVDLELNWVRGQERPADRGTEFALTPDQRETLRAAMEAGYLSIARETTMAEVAERLGVSDVAASHRLRRGLTGVVAAAVHGSAAEE